MEYEGMIELGSEEKEIIQNVDKFWSDIKTEAIDINDNNKTVDSSILNITSKDFDVYIFANFDICNFTKYKREHSDWVELLQNFLFTVLNSNSDWSLSKFWKFNGDSVTFRKKVKSIDEICRFIKQAECHLNQLQEFLNDKQNSFKRIYVKAAVWIAGFSNRDEQGTRIVNNTRFFRSPFGEEFVGENIDEGFRLSACSKAGKLVVDPKIVLIVHLYSTLCNFIAEKHGDLKDVLPLKKSNIIDYNNTIINTMNEYFVKNRIHFNLKDKRNKDVILHIFDELICVYIQEIQHLVNDVESSFYLMEYVKCKGVWDDRDYPIFWYLEDLNKCELVYDEIIDNQSLRNHKLYNLITNQKDDEKRKTDPDYCYFANARNQLINICGQIEVLSSIKQLIEHLVPYPVGLSEETIFDMANLYYMVACVVVQDGVDKGILIFKRTKERKHLKCVWDFVPIKHARIYKPNEVYSICDYIEDMLCKKINFKNDKYKDAKVFVIKRDMERNSIKPYAFCNVYRNGETHNGLLCVAEVNIDSDVNEFLLNLKNNLKADGQKQYDDCRLITLDSIQNDEIIVSENGLTIKSLSPSQVKTDSNNVAIDDSCITFGSNASEDNCEFGISYLGYSIKQILEERKYEQNRNKRTS